MLFCVLLSWYGVFLLKNDYWVLYLFLKAYTCCNACSLRGCITWICYFWCISFLLLHFGCLLDCTVQFGSSYFLWHLQFSFLLKYRKCCTRYTVYTRLLVHTQVLLASKFWILKYTGTFVQLLPIYWMLIIPWSNGKFWLGEKTRRIWCKADFILFLLTIFLLLFIISHSSFTYDNWRTT